MPIVYEVCGIVTIETPSSLHTGRPARLPIQSWSAPSSAILAPVWPGISASLAPLPSRSNGSSRSARAPSSSTTGALAVGGDPVVLEGDEHHVLAVARPARDGERLGERQRRRPGRRLHGRNHTVAVRARRE